ncbi:hypothetical protein FOCC_FOCC006491, partial [Frankliniella occidentalis]
SGDRGRPVVRGGPAVRDPAPQRGGPLGRGRVPGGQVPLPLRPRVQQRHLRPQEGSRHGVLQRRGVRGPGGRRLHPGRLRLRDGDSPRRGRQQVPASAPQPGRAVRRADPVLRGPGRPGPVPGRRVRLRGRRAPRRRQQVRVRGGPRRGQDALRAAAHARQRGQGGPAAGRRQRRRGDTLLLSAHHHSCGLGLPLDTQWPVASPRANNCPPPPFLNKGLYTTSRNPAYYQIPWLVRTRSLS